MSSLREGFDELAADVPTYGDLDRAIEQAERERRRRLGVIAGLAAAAAVVAVVVGALAVTRGDHAPPQPGPSPSPTGTRADDTLETTAPLDLPDNGRLARAEEVFARAIEPCTVVTADYELADPGADCVTTAQDVDNGGGLGLFVELPKGAATGQGTTVFVATRDEVTSRFPMPYEDADFELGPGEREISIGHGREITVVGFDGDERRTIDLSAVLAPAEGGLPSEEIIGLEWSPDATRAAVVSRVTAPEGVSARLWVIDRDGSAPVLLHTAVNTDAPANSRPLAYLWSVSWSPDGGSLGFIEELAYLGGSEVAQSRRAATITLTGSGASVPRTLYDYDAGVYDEAAILWSPDGTRTALRVPGQVLELSADGRTVGRHPLIAGFLIWLAR